MRLYEMPRVPEDDPYLCKLVESARIYMARERRKKAVLNAIGMAAFYGIWMYLIVLGVRAWLD